MKKLLLFVTVLFLASCSNDEIVSDNTNAAEETSSVSYQYNADTPQEKTAICFSNLTASYSVDVSQGLNNPAIKFSAIVGSKVNSANGYYVSLETEELTDDEDFNSGTGVISVYANSTLFTNIVFNMPFIKVKASQLPAYYKWRVVLTGQSGCKSYSDWYEAPML